MLNAISISSALMGSEPNPPMWNTDHVKILQPGQSDAQQIIDKIDATQSGWDPVANGQFN